MATIIASCMTASFFANTILSTFTASVNTSHTQTRIDREGSETEMKRWTARWSLEEAGERYRVRCPVKWSWSSNCVIIDDTRSIDCRGRRMCVRRRDGDMYGDISPLRDWDTAWWVGQCMFTAPVINIRTQWIIFDADYSETNDDVLRKSVLLYFRVCERWMTKSGLYNS